MRELTADELSRVGGGMPNTSLHFYANLAATPAGSHGQNADAIASNGVCGTPIGPITPGPYTGFPTGSFMAPMPPRQPTPFEFFQIVSAQFKP